MNSKGIIQVKSKRPPVVELDSEAHAAYVRFSSKDVAKTEVINSDGSLVTVDIDSDGNVIGIELVGVSEFNISQLLKKAGMTPLSESQERKVKYVPSTPVEV